MKTLCKLSSAAHDLNTFCCQKKKKNQKVKCTDDKIELCCNTGLRKCLQTHHLSKHFIMTRSDEVWCSSVILELTRYVAFEVTPAKNNK